jgi:lysophospholipase L1-like esterase
VGSVNNNQSCGVTAPSGGFATEGHSSELVVTNTNNGNIAKWFAANPPDIVVMHFATNDVWGRKDDTTANNIVGAYSTILTQLRAVNPTAILFVAQIIPVNPSGNNCSASNPCNFQATLNAKLPAWASSRTTTESPVIAVNLEDLYNNGYYPNSTYTTDGVHPNQAGSQPMATTMAAAIVARSLF